MKLGGSACLLTLAVSVCASACGGTPGDSLFGPGAGSQSGGTTGAGGYTFGSGFAGQVVTSGGGVGTSGFGGFVTGGFGGSIPPAGGQPSGNGGIFGGGGDAGIFAGGATGTGGADASTPSGDGAFNPLKCDFSGTWASYVSIDVTWPASIVLQPGQGKLQQWNLTHEVQAPLSTTVNVHTRPCGIFLPDLQSTVLGLFQKFGIRFPNALFDKGTIPETTFSFVADISKSPITFSTDPFAILIGIDLANPVTAAWPAASAITPRDDDHDGKPGITVMPVTPAMDPSYSLPPADLLTGESASLVYIATRTVSALSGQIQSCDRLDADVTIQTVNGNPGIDSTVIGCHKVDSNGRDSGECAANEASFVDGARPQFTPAGPGHMTIVRVADGTTCADVRNRFPLQQ